MNLNEMLHKGRIDCFKMADQAFFETNRNAFESHQDNNRYNGNPALTDNFYGSQLALISEYYLKGILLPVLEITVPEDDEKLKDIAIQLTDEQKYRIISSDATVISELQQIYGNKGISGKNIYSKLGKESLQSYGHDLNAMIKKIVDKANQGKFRDGYIETVENKPYEDRIERKEDGSIQDNLILLLKNEITDENIKSQVSDEFIKKMFSELLDETESEDVKRAFPDGRYGHLNSYIADVDKLIKVARTIREYAKDIDSGIELILKENEDKNFQITLDRCLEFPEDLKKIFVCDNMGNISRVFNWKNRNLILEYGIEQQLDRNVKNPFGVLDENKIFLECGEVIHFINKEGQINSYGTRRGKIEKTERLIMDKGMYEFEPRYYSGILEKSKINVEKGLTSEIWSQNGESELGNKFRNYYNSRLKLREIRRAQINFKLERQTNARMSKMIHDYKSRKQYFKRPDSSEFRNAYLEYVGDKLAYRLERGRQIFCDMMQYIRKGDLKSEIVEVFTKDNDEDLMDR